MNNEYLINVFKNTRELSLEKYNNSTLEAIHNTEVIVDGRIFLEDAVSIDQTVSVTCKDSIRTALDLVGSGRIAILNFADPFCPGGLVLDGVATQEEGICRCSNLYETLIQPKCKRYYYEFNKNLPNNKNWSSDRLIYSRDVLLIKDEKYNLLHAPVNVDIITSPAPMYCFDINIFEKRIECIFGSAYKNGVETLVLGKWGCGAFGDDPNIVARAFKNVIDRFKVINKVVFALYDESYGSSVFSSTLLGYDELPWL